MIEKKRIKPESYPVIIAKLDLKRCCCLLSEFKYRLSTKKKARPFRLTVNQAWERVVEGIWDAHGVNWIFPALSNAFRQMRPPSQYRTKLYSIELWHGDTLAAGELGYACGATYTSLSGYFVKDFSGAGRVQLTTLGRLLQKCGFTLWDWGMFMQYKVAYGASKFPRQRFLDIHRANLQLSPVPIEQYLATHDPHASAIIQR